MANDETEIGIGIGIGIEIGTTPRGLKGRNSPGPVHLARSGGKRKHTEKHLAAISINTEIDRGTEIEIEISPGPGITGATLDSPRTINYCNLIPARNTDVQVISVLHLQHQDHPPTHCKDGT